MTKCYPKADYLRSLVALMALAMIPVTSACANALIHVRCDELQAFGAEHAAECTKEMHLAGAIRGAPAEEVLRLGYVEKDRPDEFVSFRLQVHRIDFPSEYRAILKVAGLQISRVHTSTQGYSPITDVQGPATGTCEVNGLDAREPSIRCTAQGAGAVGDVRFAVALDAPATGSQFGVGGGTLLKELREARFVLAAAEQTGNLARWAPKASPTAQPAAREPLTDSNCVTEDQAKQAEALAASGAKDAQRLAGTCYRQAARRDPGQAERLMARAAEWFDKAIAQGDTRSMVEYGLMLATLDREGSWDATRNARVRPDATERERLEREFTRMYALAAEKGDAEGQYMLCYELSMLDMGACARLRANSPGAANCLLAARPRDAAGAVRWCQAAANQGHGGAMAMLSSFYASGRGVPKDVARSQQLLWQAAEHGDRTTLFNLARAYEMGMSESPVGPVERNIGKAIDYYRRSGNERKAAELQAAQGQVGAGVDVTVFGIGVGFELPQLPACDTSLDKDDARLCADADVGQIARWFDRLGFGQQSFAESGLRLLAVKANDQKMDTSLLFSLLGQSAALDVAIDRNRVVHYVSAQTKITATDQTLRMLTAKYGQPSRKEWDQWQDPRTGAPTRRTPVYLWDLRGLHVEFHAQHASNIGQVETPMGRIDVYTPQFGQLLQRFAAQKTEGNPAKGKF